MEDYNERENAKRLKRKESEEGKMNYNEEKVKEKEVKK